MEDKDYILTVSSAAPADNSSLPPALQKFYNAFKDKTPGEYTNVGGGGGVDNLVYGPLSITVDNVRFSIILTNDYESTTVKNMEFMVLQGYAQAVLFNRFYATSIMIGQESSINAGDITAVVEHLSTPKEEREKLEDEKIEKAKLDPSFFAQIHNDPINEAKNTNGIYIISESSKVSFETVFQAIGIADFADNPAFGLVIGISANVNTFTNKMSFTVAASIRMAVGPNFTVAGEIGLLNGKLNSIGLYVKEKIPISTGVFITQGNFSVKGFQESKIGVGVGISFAFGQEIKIPAGLGALQKALFPNKTKFCPLELNLNGEIDPGHSYFKVSGKGVILGTITVSGSFTYDNKNITAEVKAGLVRNSFLNGSLSATFCSKSDGWNLRGNFNCSVTVDFGIFFGISVSGDLSILLNSQDYTVNGMSRNKKDLTVTVAGMGKIKALFTISVAVQKTWVFHLSDTLLSDPKLLMKSISAGDASALENVQSVLVCESKDIVENQLPQLRNSSDVIETKSWQIDEQSSKSGLVRIQVAAEYTLVDSNWRLTHSNGDTVTVYTAENAEGAVTVKSFTHSYYELLLDTPDAGNWTLEILGDSKDSGGIYMDALHDEKFVTQLEIVEQTETAIKFRYSAHTMAADDTTVVRLLAEEISTEPGDNPYSGVIAYLEETENGEFIWEIPEDFRLNAQYRFYISAASSNAGSVAESNGVEVFLAQQEAELDCSWELVYNADNTDTVTAYITVKNTGAESTAFQWEILDYTNNDSVESDENYYGNTFDTADVIATGKYLEIKGNSSVTFEHVLTVTNELRDNPSSLYLAVTQYTENDEQSEKSGSESENYSDDTDEILFTAMESENCRKQTISWQAVDGAVSYVLHYALEGDWDTGGVFVNNIYSNSYVLSVAPGEYVYRVIAMDNDGKSIGTWSEEQVIDVLFHDDQIISIAENISSSRSQTFSLNDGIYSLTGTGLENFSGTVVLYCNKLSQVKKSNTVKITAEKVLTLTFVDGKLSKPVNDILLDHGEYYWEWKRKGKEISSESEISIQLTGEVFPAEDKDRACAVIGGEDSDVTVNSDGVNVETLTGEIGFFNKDAIYQYITDVGGELSLSIKSNTTVDAKFKVYIYVQNYKNDKFTRVKSITVKAGEYSDDSVILSNLAITNNFYIQIVSWDNGKGKYNTDYELDLSFDAFEDNVQNCDIIEVDGSPVQEWIGYRNAEHRYLLQIDTDDLYAVRLQGDVGDAVLKICSITGKVIKKMKIQADGTAYLDNIYLESSNYFVVVESKDGGKGNYNTDYTLSVSKMQTLYPTEILSIDGESVNKWIGYQNPSHTYRLEVESDGRYCIRLGGDAKEAVLKVCDLQGKVIKKMQINADGCANIDDIYLDSGNYFVVVESKDKGKGKYNTDYTLSAAKLQTLYPKADNSNDTWKDAAILDGAALEENIAAWLGVGDQADFFKISLDTNTTSSYLSIELDEQTAQAVKDGILQFSCRDEKGKTLKLYEVEPGQFYTKKTVSGSEIYVGVSLKKPEESIDYSFETTLAAKL